ncbi:MAG: rRNA pseudouridine synthase [Firmicutes bacterium]|nr:rRNA pseudouridine synthase [Bacillota bacterium]
MERLHKLMARAGVGSRRACEAMIKEGRVQVNGEVVTELGTKVDPTKDTVSLDGRVLRLIPETREYLLLHKPPGYVTTVRDPWGRPTIMDLLGPMELRLYPAGRLDFDSEGLVLLTNDGDLVYRLTHPSFGVEKVYLVEVAGRPTAHALEELARGVELEDGPTAPAKVRLVEERPGSTCLEFTIKEGRKRQIRRMCDKVGHGVLRLCRIRLGPVQLGSLPPGKWRHLKDGEIRALRKAVSLD